MTMNQYSIGSQSLQAGIGMAKDAMPPQHLESIDGDLQKSLSLLHESLARLRVLADRVVGAQPEPVSGNGQTNPQAMSMVRRLEDTAGFIRNTANDVAGLIARLERL